MGCCSNDCRCLTCWDRADAVRRLPRHVGLGMGERAAHPSDLTDEQWPVFYLFATAPTTSAWGLPGDPAAGVEEATSRLGFQLPAALREAYASVGSSTHFESTPRTGSCRSTGLTRAL
jgi:hypothetical protein